MRNKENKESLSVRFHTLKTVFVLYLYRAYNIIYLFNISNMN